MRRPRVLVLVLGAFLTFAAALAQPDFGFMPDGGRETLARLTGAGRLKLNEVVLRKSSEEEWSAVVRAADNRLDLETVATLASYLALNMPLAITSEVTADLLPADGKQLAIDNCQFCHSFFTGYLVQARDTEGWRAIFKSPFHSELPMSPVERETFARYSAINLPIPVDEVPEELRF